MRFAFSARDTSAAIRCSIGASSRTTSPSTTASGAPSPVDDPVAPGGADPFARGDNAGEVQRIGGADGDGAPSAGMRRTSRSRSTASGSANCSPDMPVTNRPPRISPRASSRR